LPSDRRERKVTMQDTRDVFATRVWSIRMTLRSWLVVGLCMLIGLTGCEGGGGGGGGGGGQGGGASPALPTQSGTGTVSLRDPPTCKARRSDLNRVWVTITLVRAHLSSTAAPEDSGWVTLVDRRTNPLQIDLFDTSETTCILT